MAQPLMNFKFNLEVAIPPRNGIDGRMVARWESLPFVPHAGMMVLLGENDQFYEVERVYYDTTAKGCRFEVFLKHEEYVKLKDVLKCGWRLDD